MVIEECRIASHSLIEIKICHSIIYIHELECDVVPCDVCEVVFGSHIYGIICHFLEKRKQVSMDQTMKTVIYSWY